MGSAEEQPSPTSGVPSDLSDGSDRSADDPFLADVLRGLSQRQKAIPPKYFYNERGSKLFDRICELEEYYPTRTELAVLQRYAGEMAEAIGPECVLIELGSGSGLKTRILLQNLHRPTAYIPIDISGEHLAASVAAMADDFPDIEMLPVRSDFTALDRLPKPAAAWKRNVVYFPGSTIGNFDWAERGALLAHMADLAGPGGGVVIGIDLEKDAAVLEAAYNDRAGVTRLFNLNLLSRANRELGADFDLHAFEHRAFYNAAEARIEMHLVSRTRQTVTVAGRPFRFEPGETIHTESSYKFTIEEFARSARVAGLALERAWTDDDDYFGVLYFSVNRGD